MRVKPFKHHIIVAWQDCDRDERGRQIVPGSAAGLAYGREVHVPVAVVLDVGPDVQGVQVGDRIVATKSLGELFEVGGLEVQAIATHVLDPRTEAFVPTDDVTAILGEDGPRAVGRRIIGRPVSGQVSEVLEVEVDDGCERLEVLSVGAEVAGVRPGDVILARWGSDRRVAWNEGAAAFVSVLEGSVEGIGTPLAPHFEAPGGTQWPKKCANPGNRDGL